MTTPCVQPAKRRSRAMKLRQQLGDPSDSRTVAQLRSAWRPQSSGDFERVRHGHRSLPSYPARFAPHRALRFAYFLRPGRRAGLLEPSHLSGRILDRSRRHDGSRLSRQRRLARQGGSPLHAPDWFSVLTSLFTAAFEVSQRTSQSALAYPSPAQTAGSAVGQELSQTGAQITRRNLNVQPTIKVPAGYKFNVRVDRDIVFDAPYTQAAARDQRIDKVSSK